MAGEVLIVIPSLPTTAYFVVCNAVGEFWNTSGTPAFEAYNAANWTSYDVALSQSGASQHYAGTFPSTIPAGVYSLTAYVQAGGSPAVTDSLAGSDTAFYWTGSVRGALSQLATPTNITAATGVVLAGVTHTGAVIPTVTTVGTLTTYTGNTPQTGDAFALIGATGSGLTSLAPAATALSTATWTGTLATNLGTLASHDPGATLGTSTLTQTQVTGGAYALNSASFSFNAAMDFTTTQKAATLARVTLVDTTTTNTDMRGTDNAATAANLATVASYLDTEIADILADTNELQTDWANGGRLDLILDARASQTSVDDIPTVSEFNARTLASADYATPTNITAGTITTVTNLTNAPTVGDFTATMKTSITTAATAATPTVTAGTVTDKTGYALTAAYDAAKTAATQTSVDTIDGNVDLILADTAELQNDWVNGGRLDLILDARASETNATVNKAAILSVVADVYTDVNTILTRIPAALFAGITSLAQWLGLIAGKQTGNSTARTELRATGAGSGTFDETTDSQEALRDRGDVAWISGAGASAADIAAALASQPIVIQSPTTTNGTLDLVQGMDYYTADGREIEFTFVRDYVPSSCKLTIAAGAVVTVTSTDISESSGSGSGRFHVRFELPRTTGDDLEAGTGTFEVYSIVGTRQVPEIAEGVATIRRRLTA